MTDADSVDGQPVLGAWGVEPGYWDISGHWRAVPEHVLRAVLHAMGAGAPEPAPDAPLVTVGPHGPWPGLPAGHLHLEGGGRLEIPPPEGYGELPVGYHRLERTDGRPALTVAVCPRRCPAPPPGRTWGWSAQLYACRSRASWGIGDFADLRQLAQWAASNGAGFVLLNPLHAPAPNPVPEPSPYFPSSRCFLNPLYIRVEDVAGSDRLPQLRSLAERGRALNASRLIDRASVWAYKSEALEALFELFETGTSYERQGLDAYIEQRGRLLDGYTSFCALAEVHGLPWQEWPEDLRRPDCPAVAAFSATPLGQSRKRYYAWLQWLCESQLGAASSDGGASLICDLAVGVGGGGADAWYWQDIFDLGVRVGAPPDEFNSDGQDWELPPWDPWKLRAAAYEPYLEVLRAVLRPSRGLRMDHVMGLFRLYWVPVGEPPAHGAYVRYVWQDMVRLLRLEAWRAGAYVVGEDLGTVEDHVREVLAGSGVLSYKLLWFEPCAPAEWAAQALGAVTTHDLPTVAGVWTGADLEAQRAIGVPVNEAGSRAFRQRIAEWTSSTDDRPVDEVIEATYGALAAAPCSLLVAVLDDAAAVKERPNMPGTIDEWPNWCLALPVPLEQVETSELAASIARALNGG